MVGRGRDISALLTYNRKNPKFTYDDVAKIEYAYRSIRNDFLKIGILYATVYIVLTYYYYYKNSLWNSVNIQEHHIIEVILFRRLSLPSALMQSSTVLWCRRTVKTDTARWCQYRSPHEDKPAPVDEEQHPKRGDRKRKHPHAREDALGRSHRPYGIFVPADSGSSISSRLFSSLAKASMTASSAAWGSLRIALAVWYIFCS